MARHSRAAFDAVVWLAAALVAASFLALLGHVTLHGISAGGLEGNTAAEMSLAGFLGRWVEFVFASPGNFGRSGGIAPVLVSTLLILAVCLAVVLPLGLSAAIFLSETVAEAGLPGRLVRRSLDVLAGVPSIVFGLFGNALFCHLLGLRFSILAGGLTLACMVLPLVIRAGEQGLRGVALEQRQAAAALGLSRASVVWRVLLPQAAPALAAGMVLGTGRALAETAALLFTSGSVDRMPRSLADSGRSLAVHIYHLAMDVPGGDSQAYASALVLVVLVAAVNALTIWLTRRFVGSTGVIR